MIRFLFILTAQWAVNLSPNHQETQPTRLSQPLYTSTPLSTLSLLCICPETPQPDGPQRGPADDGKRLDFLSPAMDVVYRKVYLKGRESEGGVGSRLDGILG